MPTTPRFETLLYKTEPPVATITLNRPEALNTIVPPMPEEVEAAVDHAERDPAVKVIVLRGAGRAFCGGGRPNRSSHRYTAGVSVAQVISRCPPIS